MKSTRRNDQHAYSCKKMTLSKHCTINRSIAIILLTFVRLAVWRWVPFELHPSSILTLRYFLRPFFSLRRQTAIQWCAPFPLFSKLLVACWHCFYSPCILRFCCRLTPGLIFALSSEVAENLTFANIFNLSFGKMFLVAASTLNRFLQHVG